MFLLPPQSVGSVYSGLMQGVGAAEKVFEFIDRQPTMVHDGSLAPDHLEGRVDFENVTFTYRTRPHTQVLQVREGLNTPTTTPNHPFPPPISLTPPTGQAVAVQPRIQKAESLHSWSWALVGEGRALTKGFQEQC